ncbi:MAG TPA: CoB--CoM heterodisulfide reductase iron-sulfur subunit A family protein [Candidatus Acidoferrales bacterium]|nr:CoB--CoM heterodisulfide reductase iron-sulfur subunit A family protein [Candidatus Acidoferrales bacterium]
MPEPVGYSEVHNSILVVGGGIAGLSAAIEAAEAGSEVFLVEKEGFLGGRVAQLAKYFPKLCPPHCGLEINYQRLKKNRRVRFFTMAQVERIEGRPGDFTVAIRQRPRYVNDRCTACNDCVAACPVDRPDRFNLGMGVTRAVYIPYPMAFPRKYAIDDSVCPLEQCAKCVDACSYGAIDLAMQPKTFDLKVGAVVFATGWQPYDAGRIDNLGFGRYADVITNMMLERLAAPDGPTRGRIVRPSDGKPVRSVAFVQCAGSRDASHLGYCSSICCMASLKEAVYIREQIPEAKVHIFYIDLRTPGPLEFFSKRVQADPGVSVMKGKVAAIVEDRSTGELIVQAEDILSSRKISLRVDLVVLATGMASSVDQPPEGPLAYDNDGFLLPDETAPGIFAAGCARGPVDVATAVQDATAAALKAMRAIHQAGAQRNGGPAAPAGDGRAGKAEVDSAAE